MSVPMEEMEVMPEEQEGQEGQMLSEEDEQDIDIVVALAMDMIEGEGEGPSGAEVIQQLLGSPKPENQFAMFMTQMIEAVMTDPTITELGVNPAIIMAQGGVLDELTDELSDLVGEDLTDIMEAAKPVIMQNVQKRADQFAQEGQPMEQTPPPQGPRPVMAGA